MCGSQVIEEGFNKKGFCLTKNDLGQTQLSRDHAYYYQVQSQINICKQASYGYFIVWSESNIYIERILPDKVFWNGLVVKATTFFKTCLIPELVGKFYNRSTCPLPNSLLQSIDYQESTVGNSTTINY